MSFFDYYALLGCDPRTTAAEITKIYREKARKLHPDKNVHNNLSAHEVFVKLVKAKEILTDKKKRATYDRQYRLYWQNKMRNRNKNKNKKENKQDDNKKQHENGNSNKNKEKSRDNESQHKETINVTRDLIEMLIRGSYHKHGFDAQKIHDDLYTMVNGARYSIIIMKSGNWTALGYNTVSVYIGATVIYAIRNENKAQVDRQGTKEWLNDEYGWITGYTEMTKLRDNICNKIKRKFGKYYNITLIPKVDCVHYHIYGVVWDAKDNQTRIFICDQ